MNLYFITAGNDDEESGDLIAAPTAGKAKSLYQQARREPVVFTDMRCMLLERGVDRPAGPLAMDDSLHEKWLVVGDNVETLP